jgi:hypothetical protein
MSAGRSPGWGGIMTFYIDTLNVCVLTEGDY